MSLKLDIVNLHSEPGKQVKYTASKSIACLEKNVHKAVTSLCKAVGVVLPAETPISSSDFLQENSNTGDRFL